MTLFKEPTGPYPDEIMSLAKDTQQAAEDKQRLAEVSRQLSEQHLRNLGKLLATLQPDEVASPVELSPEE